MSHLLSETSHADITATMEVLARCGVRFSDLKAFLAASKIVQQRIADGFIACKLGEDSALSALAGSTVVHAPEWAFKPSDSQIKAAEIMGRDFLGVKEMAQYYNVTPTKEELEALETVPFSEAQLRDCVGPHVLVADFGLSVMDVRGQYSELFFSESEPWYGSLLEGGWARKRAAAQWRLLRKTAIPNSFNKDAESQKALLVRGEEEIPAARDVVYMVIGYYLARGEKLFPKYYVRTASLSGAGDRIGAGFFDASGLFINSWNDNPNSLIGLASSVKVF